MAHDYVLPHSVCLKTPACLKHTKGCEINDVPDAMHFSHPAGKLRHWYLSLRRTVVLCKHFVHLFFHE